MNLSRISLFLLVLGSLVGLSVPARASSSATPSFLQPQSVLDSACCSNGAVSSMWTLDQSGTQDAPGQYVAFTTPGHRYRGYRSYFLPSAIPRSSVYRLQVKVNYKGPAASTQVWRWSAWNWDTSSWTRIGSNGAAQANTWTVMKFRVSNERSYINSSTGEIRIRLASSNGSGNAKLDYEAVLISAVGQSPDIVGCSLFPPDNVWNTPISTLPVHARSNAWISSMGASSPRLHMDFGANLWEGGPIGLPYNVVDGTQVPKYTIKFYYWSESDPGPYPIPAYPAREWGGDLHLLTVDTSNCTLYELYKAKYSNGKWHAGSGAIWDLGSNALRPADWTSADAAGLPMLPGLVRYQEIASALKQTNPADQIIHHALRFTANDTNSYIWPARHLTAGSAGTLTNVPPMGARFRLKAGYDISGFDPVLQVILRTMKTYGIIVADDGASWMVSGSPDQRWNNSMLQAMGLLHGSDFEAVDERCLIVSPDSGQADLSRCP